MLKIKDNVYLKELEKYGFNRPKYVRAYIANIKTGRNIEDNTNYEIELPTRKIKIFSLGTINYDLLYDLIKADLVEKVEK
jgi:hypothetical protein